MALIDDLGATLEDLAGRGWGGLFRSHGIVIDGGDLAADLERPLDGIDRNLPGFLGFTSAGQRAVTPGDPARSLLYHVLASPNVHPSEGLGPEVYPSLAELDLVENYVYSRARSELGSLVRLVPAVFAYQYRVAGRTAHRRHDDLVFSRCAIARNGTESADYDPVLRCFSAALDSPEGARVMPARYGLFLARRHDGETAWRDDRPDGTFALVGNRRKGDRERGFLVPVHKLFSGPECLPDVDLAVAFVDYHRNEKLRRAGAAERGLGFAADFDQSRPPFLIESKDGAGFVDREMHGGSIVIAPRPGPLIQVAKQDPATGGEARVVTFPVPGKFPYVNRRYTSLRITDSLWTLIREGLESVLRDLLGWFGLSKRYPRPRNAPEFVNIRHRLEAGQLNDMLSDPPGRDAFLERVAEGAYQAVAFVDGCAEGYVGATITGGPILGPTKPAYSVIAPPDYLPYVDQIEIDREVSSDDYFKQGGPSPLCYDRLPVNPAITLPDGPVAPFERQDTTLVAIVGPAPRGAADGRPSLRPARTTTYLTDSSSNVFAPGWDTTYAADDQDVFYATYGLGSPFPEDVKLCAAANAFWPAVSPDASRTFGRSDTPTAIPLLDGELGYHPGHPWTSPRRSVESRPGWDGEHGPFVDQGGHVVNFADIERSDYVANIRAGRARFSALADLSSAEIIGRMEVLRRAVAEIDNGRAPADSRFWLVSAEAVDWADFPTAHGDLTGRGYRLIFITAESLSRAVQAEPGRLELGLTGDLVRCDLDDSSIKVTRAPRGPEALALYG